MAEAKVFKITFTFIGGETKTYEVSPIRGLSEIRKIILNEKWYEINTKEIVNLANVTNVEITE
ncbi:MAG: hypothetical protein WAM95_06130 [Bacillus sp. (in: firmicutes)]